MRSAAFCSALEAHVSSKPDTGADLTSKLRNAYASDGEHHHRAGGGFGHIGGGSGEGERVTGAHDCPTVSSVEVELPSLKTVFSRAFAVNASSAMFQLLVVGM